MSEVLKRATILNPKNPNVSTKVFNGDFSGILNWNNIKYSHWYSMYKTLVSNYWQSDEISMGPDVKQFEELSEAEKRAFLMLIGGSLATFDGPQTAMALRLSLYATDPSVQAIMAVIAQQEAVHNESYSVILSSIVDNDVEVAAFELGRTDPYLLKRNERISEIYNEFANNPTLDSALNAIVYTAKLEGLFFYAGFAFFYNLARNDKMLKTSTMIGYINRDELEHGRFISELYRATLAENPEYNTPQRTEWVYDQFRYGVEQEQLWAEYVLKDVEGIDLTEMNQYIEYRANKLLRMLGYEEIYEVGSENPMKWIRAYVDEDTKSDFFEQRPRNYNRVNSDNGFDDL